MGGGRMGVLNLFNKKEPKMTLHKVLKSCFLMIISLSFISCTSTQKTEPDIKKIEATIKGRVYTSEVICKHLFSDKERSRKEYVDCVKDVYRTEVEFHSKAENKLLSLAVTVGSLITLGSLLIR